MAKGTGTDNLPNIRLCLACLVDILDDAWGAIGAVGSLHFVGANYFHPEEKVGKSRTFNSPLGKGVEKVLILGTAPLAARAEAKTKL